MYALTRGRAETMNEKETTTTESLLVSEVSSPTVHNPLIWRNYLTPHRVQIPLMQASREMEGLVSRHQILQSMLQMAYGTTME